MFEKPINIFQQRVKELLKNQESIDIVKDLVKLHMFKNSEKNEENLALIELYNLVGLDHFANIITLFNGKTISFPTKEDFQETIQLALCYYYKYIEGKDWDQIKSLLGDEDLPTIRYGIRIQQLQKFLRMIATRLSTNKGNV